MWGGTGTAIGPGAQSTIDGASNTQAIVNTLGSSSSYAARLCATYNGGGYTDWFLPSSEQLHCLWSYYANIGGFYLEVIIGAPLNPPRILLIMQSLKIFSMEYKVTWIRTHLLEFVA